eukprot:TRINITY_DN47697_c0_g1_i1.p1 TRINITY_DN47697_c0_g1~~TRINITY_DN47697_c0_g1_i1.p1  ORF type:complete len:532 (+),score=140.09 TRINITY_DN47697_c0_g1_i1:120-1715(+)
MPIPPQEDWSPELLSELQRAVPVLESSTLELASTGGRDERYGAGGRDDDDSLQGCSAVLAAQFSGSGGSPSDLLSDDAMNLPMSTLTSGRRRTYANKSTFQAHVCCVMDPMQVATVLDMLRSAPHLQSARCWPHAYRIISPFDGQTHEGSDDDGDPGAGEKMLGLLTRMKLENLLLIVSHWDSGPTNRLGTELFRCVNEQCKDLLMELQQAVRASFPPEALLGATTVEERTELCSALVLPHQGGGGAAAGEAQRQESDGNFFLTAAGQQEEQEDALDFDFRQSTTSSEQGELTGRGMLALLQHKAASGGKAEATLPAGLVDLRPLGMSPPSQLLWASRGVVPTRPKRGVRHASRRLAERPSSFSALGAGAPFAQRPRPGRGGTLLASAAAPPARGSDLRQAGAALVSWQGTTPRSPYPGSPSRASPSSSEGGAVSEASPRPQQLESSAFCNGPGDVETFGAAMAAMSNEELLSLGARLRGEREGLHKGLGDLVRVADEAAAAVGEPGHEHEQAARGNGGGRDKRRIGTRKL